MECKKDVADAIRPLQLCGQFCLLPSGPEPLLASLCLPTLCRIDNDQHTEDSSKVRLSTQLLDWTPAQPSFCLQESWITGARHDARQQ